MVDMAVFGLFANHLKTAYGKTKFSEYFKWGFS